MLNTMKREWIEGSLLAVAHNVVRDHVALGHTVVDATMGNGHDTLFLCECVGEKGRVIGFDVQEEALLATRSRLEEAGIDTACYVLHRLGHEMMGAHVFSDVSVVMFNLGYLPGSDKTMITKVDTTLKALDSAVELLEGGGVLCVMCYPGHSGGEVEAEAVLQWIQESGSLLQQVVCYRRVGGSERAPFLLVAEKR